jgi:hypothetical protein
LTVAALNRTDLAALGTLIAPVTVPDAGSLEVKTNEIAPFFDSFALVEVDENEGAVTSFGGEQLAIKPALPGHPSCVSSP